MCHSVTLCVCVWVWSNVWQLIVVFVYVCGPTCDSWLLCVGIQRKECQRQSLRRCLTHSSVSYVMRKIVKWWMNCRVSSTAQITIQCMSAMRFIVITSALTNAGNVLICSVFFARHRVKWISVNCHVDESQQTVTRVWHRVKWISVNCHVDESQQTVTRVWHRVKWISVNCHVDESQQTVTRVTLSFDDSTSPHHDESQLISRRYLSYNIFSSCWHDTTHLTQLLCKVLLVDVGHCHILALYELLHDYHYYYYYCYN